MKMIDAKNDSETAHALREKVLALHELLSQKSSTTTFTAPNDSNATRDGLEEKTARNKEEAAMASAGQKALSEFMNAAGQAITFVESREIWNNMCATNNGSFPRLEVVFFEICRQCLSKGMRHSSRLESSYKSSMNDLSETSEEELSESEDLEQGEGSESDTSITEQQISELSDQKLELFAVELAKGIKDAYSIRKREDNSELKFILGSMSILWIAVGSIAVSGYYYAETNPKIGTFNRVTLRSILLESFILFAAELIWECFLSWIVLRYNIKINYTRKLGNLLKVPKYFVADFFPDFTSTALSMTTALAINQTLFCAMYYRRSREKVPFFSYVFLSQDRREDRPDTLIFQVTEDIMRFAIYFPFKLLVVDLIKSPAIIFIPIAVNNIGDGLAEPVGVAFGKHKYSTTALYYSKFP